MSTPRELSAYPAAMIDSLHRAIAQGEFIIPCEKPAAIRLQFYGFLRALREAGKGELADSVSFYLQKTPKALIVRRKSGDTLTAVLHNALNPTTIGDAEGISDEAFNRLFGR